MLVDLQVKLVEFSCDESLLTATNFVFLLFCILGRPTKYLDIISISKCLLRVYSVAAARRRFSGGFKGDENSGGSSSKAYKFGTVAALLRVALNTAAQWPYGRARIDYFCRRKGSNIGFTAACRARARSNSLCSLRASFNSHLYSRLSLPKTSQKKKVKGNPPPSSHISHSV